MHIFMSLEHFDIIDSTCNNLFIALGLISLVIAQGELLCTMVFTCTSYVTLVVLHYQFYL